MAVRNDFSSGEVLTAADLNDTFASKVDYATPTNAQTGTTYTFVAADAEKLTTASNGSAVTLTIPPASSVAWPDETILRVVNYGAGAVTIDGGSGVTVTNTSSTIAQYGAAVAIRTGSDAWTVVPFGGGDVPSATVSSPAATGQYTDGSGDTWDYYTFTSSGTLTVDTAGFADILVIAGGGGGGSNAAGGGGGGGAVAYEQVYLEAQTWTVTIGAGGSGAPTTSVQGSNGSLSQMGKFATIGGGGGGGAVAANGLAGGSGGGANGAGAVGSAVAHHGNDGGSGASSGGGGGGGGGGVGANAATGVGGNGGSGLSNDFDGSTTSRAGGGGGGGTANGTGTDGGGDGGNPGTNGTANTGGGGGGGQPGGTAGGNGGSGIVIVRVKV